MVKRNVVILAAVTTSRKGRDLPCKVFVASDSPEGLEAGFRIDSVVDCQTLTTLPSGGVIARLGRVPTGTLADVDRALEDALGLGN